MSALMEWLRAQKDKRGVLAQLRYGIVPAKAQRTWPLLARFGGIEGHKGEVVRTVAALYASHSDEARAGGMGALCLHLCSKEEKPGQDEKPGPIAMRLQYLLAAETPEVCQRAVRLVLRAKTQGIAVNYAGLHKDLLEWQWPEQRERIQARWAQEFWAPATSRQATSAPSTPSADSAGGDNDDAMPPDVLGDDDGGLA